LMLARPRSFWNNRAPRDLPVLRNNYQAGDRLYNNSSNQQFNRPGQQPANSSVDNLTRQLEKLQINLRQADALRDSQQQEITRLKAALRRPNDSIQLMETLWEPEEYLTHQGTEYDQVLIKRNMTDDGDTPYVRMPHKRVAITPTSQTPYQAPRRTTPPPPPVMNPTSATNQTTPAGPTTPGLDRTARSSHAPWTSACECWTTWS
jgi:hypothetical protein